MSPIEPHPEVLVAPQPGQSPAEPSRVGEEDGDWRWLYRTGGLAAALLVVVGGRHWTRTSDLLHVKQVL
jgi:hypothetical protein